MEVTEEIISGLKEQYKVPNLNCGEKKKKGHKDLLDYNKEF